MKPRRVHTPRQRPAMVDSTTTAPLPDVPPDDHELLYGRQPVRELLRARRRTIHRVTLLDSALSTPELREIEALARKAKVPVASANRARISAQVGDVNHQGVVAETGPYPYLKEADLIGLLAKRPQPFVLVLDHLQDVHNVGSLIRTADAAGVDAVVLTTRRAAAVTPAAVRVSAGASEHMKIAAVPNLVRAMKAMTEVGLWFVGLEGSEEAVPYTEQSLTGGVGLVVGSEGAGMRRQTREACDHLIMLPQLGAVSSLNAAVAGAIAMFECRRQRELSATASVSAQ